MASGADFPVRTICPLPRLSVRQGIAAVPRPFMMNGKHAAIELTRVPLFHHVDDHIGKRVGIAVEMLGLERGTDELLERRKFIDGTKPAVGAEMIRRHKGVRPVIETPPRVILR